jgi:2-succinyl-6-hydroxy-2,4-cyclohexadiene-1-carboxylate synthase
MRRPPLLLLHGFTGAPSDFAPLVAASIAPTCLAPWMPGHGPDASRDAQADSMDRCVRRIVGELDAIGLRRVDVLGYSMGGRVALSLLAAVPGRVRRCVVIGAHAGIVDEAERAERGDADRALADRIEQIGAPAFLAEWAQTPLIATQARAEAAPRAAMARARALHRAPGLAASLRGMGAGAMAPVWDALRAVDVPALAVAGDEDVRYRAHAAALAATLPRAVEAVLPGAGHAPHLEQPASLATIVASFLAGA